jgi:hypothetical protein
VIQLLFFLFIGAALLSSLFLLGRRGSRAEGDSQVLVEARQALTVLQLNLLPRDLVARIFAKDDFDYVNSVGCKPVNALFSVERRKIALSWVSQVRAHVLVLRGFHLGAARFYSRLSLRTEIGVAWHFMTLLLACRALQALLYAGGPNAAPRVVGATVAVAGRVCAASEKSLAFLNPVQIAPLQSSSAGALGS